MRKTQILFTIWLSAILTLTLGACNLPGGAPPDNDQAPQVIIPTGQSGGLVPLGQDTPIASLQPEIISGGPKAWIAFPTSGALLPHGTGSIMLEIYASDPVGVRSIQVKVNGWPLTQREPKSAADDGGKTLVLLEQQFMDGYKGYVPSSDFQGQYTVEAVAINVNGVSSPPSKTTFCLGSCLYTPLAPPGVKEETATPTQSSEIKIVDFFTDSNSVDAGKCRTLHWKVSGTKEGIYLDGELVAESGSRDLCPCENEIHELRVIAADGSIAARRTSELYINEGTSCGLVESESPPSEPEAADPPEEWRDAEDTTYPAIFNDYLVWGDCKFYGRAGLYDSGTLMGEPSGMAQAKFGYNLNDQGWKWVWMSEIGNGEWQSDSSVSVMDNIGTPIGHIEYQFWAKDNAGNENYSEIWEYDYTSCSG